jgi:putative hydrolase of the HAD superfamily
MAINTILFDFGGVLWRPLDGAAMARRRDRLARRLNFADGVEMWERFYGGDEWAACKVGRMTRAEMWRALLSPHGLENPVQLSRFVDELFAGEGLPPDMARLLERLRPLYRLGVLSNYDDSLEGILQNRLRILDYFAAVANSYRIGAAKPEPESYQRALEMLGARPEEVFFIDDKERNTTAAEALGITSHLYRDGPTLEADLVRRGLLPGP